MEKVDLSVEVAGVKLKNPLIVGASDMTCTLRGIARCAESGVGGVVMKSLSLQALPRTRTCPFAFSAERFGRGLDAGPFGGSEAYSVYLPEVWLKEFGREAVKACHDAGAVFIASMALQMGDEKQALVDLARRIEDIGPDMLQIPSYVCPNQSAVPEAETTLRIEEEFIAAIREAVSIPISAKINISVYPQLFTRRCRGYENAGASHISLMIGAVGLAVDAENEDFFGLPLPAALTYGRAVVPEMSMRIVEAKQAGVKISICPSGGVWQLNDAIGYMLLGAETMEVCSLAYTKGPRALGRLVSQIEDWMDRKGYRSVSQFTGKLLPRVRNLEDVVPEVYPLPSPITPVIDYDLCNLCSVCVDSCVYVCLERVDREQGRVVMNKELCWGCGLCVLRCPMRAIRLEDKSGTVFMDGRGSVKLWQPAGRSIS